jgi:L-histidine Nalpha-methyltransferase
MDREELGVRMRTQGITAYPAASFAAEVRAGLSRDGQKELPSKYFYDEIGSALFDVISLLPEYGLTRADERLLRRHSPEIVSKIPSPVTVAELGSGTGKKTRWILEALCARQSTTYYPIEISPSALARCELELARMDCVSVIGFEKEYLDGLLEVASRRAEGEHLLVLFLGSTIGNFDAKAGLEFLSCVREVMLPGDALLLGTDLEKPVPQVLAAYEDSLGVTAAFNLNLLRRINRELNGDFELSRFRHHVRYDAQERRIEMHLRSTVKQTVTIRGADLAVTLEMDETIWTESSYKYTLEQVAGMADATRFRCIAQWVDRDWLFAQNLFIAH